MKKVIFIISLIISNLTTLAQTGLPDSVDLNLLNAPSNPAFNLMGISTNSIDKPTDLNSFRISVQNATNSFSHYGTKGCSSKPLFISIGFQ